MRFSWVWRKVKPLLQLQLFLWSAFVVHYLCCLNKVLASSRKHAFFFSSKEEGGEKILKMVLKDPTAINKKEVKKIQIHFDSQFDVLTQLFNVMGKDKVMASISPPPFT